MLRKGAMGLSIVGKAKLRIVKQVTRNYTLKQNQGWFFVDYALEEIALNTRFDVLLEGESKKLISGPGSTSIKLLSCFDQFGNKFTSIPKGYKMICKLEFDPEIPSVIKKLPFLDGWDYNPNAISLLKHEDIELAIPDVVLNDLYKIIYVQFKTSFANKPNHPIYKKDFIDYIEKSYSFHSNSANQILHTLLQLGKVTQKQNNQLEFA